MRQARAPPLPPPRADRRRRRPPAAAPGDSPSSLCAHHSPPLPTPCPPLPRSWELPWGAANPWFVVSTVLNGGRLELPAAGAALPGPGRLPPPLLARYQELLQACWAQDKAARPRFKEVADRLRQLLGALGDSAAAAAAARRAAGAAGGPPPAAAPGVVPAQS